MKIEQLTFTRFIAAMSIFVYHYGMGAFPFNLRWFSFLKENSKYGVSYFFVLSGFVMVIAYGHQNRIDLKEYFKKRFGRIYPAYFMAILLVAISKILSNSSFDLLGMSLNLLAIQAWIPGQALAFNGPGWSLSVEVFFYLIFPFLISRIYQIWRFKTVLINVTVIWLLSQFLFHFGLGSSFFEPYPSAVYQLLFYFPVMHFNEFLVGNLAALFFFKMREGQKRNFDLLIFALTVLLILILKSNVGFNFHNGLLALIFVPLIWMISLNNGKLTTVLRLRPFVFFGEISYGIYIYQFPVFSLVGGTLIGLGIHNPATIFYSTAVALILVSAISFVFLEEPIRQYFNHQLKAKN